MFYSFQMHEKYSFILKMFNHWYFFTLFASFSFFVNLPKIFLHKTKMFNHKWGKVGIIVHNIPPVPSQFPDAILFWTPSDRAGSSSSGVSAKFISDMGGGSKSLSQGLSSSVSTMKCLAWSSSTRYFLVWPKPPSSYAETIEYWLKGEKKNQKKSWQSLF